MAKKTRHLDRQEGSKKILSKFARRERLQSESLNDFIKKIDESARERSRITEEQLQRRMGI